MANLRPYSAGSVPPDFPHDIGNASRERYQTPDPEQRSNSVPNDTGDNAAQVTPLHMSGSRISRLGRRQRPNITLFNAFGAADEPLPSIEVGDASPAPAAPTMTSAPSHSRLLDVEKSAPAPLQSAFSRVAAARSHTPTNLAAFAAAIGRSGSAFSTSSSSSCASSPSEQVEVFSVTGSATSPETEAPTPRGSMHKRMRPSVALTYGAPQLARPVNRLKKVSWTKPMDQHLWGCLLRYMSDPQKAPFHMRSGQAPPGGVQHFVAREAKRTWRGQRYPDALGPTFMREDSVDTLMSNVESSFTMPKPASKSWPSKTATRARLRELCREQSDFTTHLQHQMKSRSPTPLSPRGLRTGGRLRRSAYDVDDVRISLATSTSTTMRRNGPLAQLATHSDEYFAGLSEWFNNPAVPYASTASARAAPVASGPEQFGGLISSTPSVAPPVRLGSPFARTPHQHHNTWTSGMLRQHVTTAERTGPPRDINPFASVPRLRSPAPLADPFAHRPLASNKRRAPFPLEDAFADERRVEPQPELVATHSSDLFGPTLSTQRRVRRSRGLTLNDVFMPRPAPEPGAAHAPAGGQAYTLPVPPPPPQRLGLGSPFDGIASRPSRARPARSTVQVFGPPDATAFTDIEAPRPTSIDERLQGDHHMGGVS